MPNSQAQKAYKLRPTDSVKGNLMPGKSRKVIWEVFWRGFVKEVQNSCAKQRGISHREENKKKRKKAQKLFQ